MREFIIVKDDVDKFTLKFFIDGEEYYNGSLDNVATNHLYISTIKVLNTLRKVYNMTIDRQKLYVYDDDENISASCSNYDNAKKACDWLNSILLSNEMKGFDVLRNEQKMKKDASYEKRIDKKFNEIKKYIGLTGTFFMYIQSSSNIINTKLKIKGCINNVTKQKKNIILDTSIGKIEATYTSFQFQPDKLSIINDGQSIIFNIN